MASVDRRVTIASTIGGFYVSNANTPRLGFVLEYVKDASDARAFYTDILGMRISRESPEFIQFADANGAGWAIASDASMSGEPKPETYWIVEDIAAFAASLADKAAITHPLEKRPFGQVLGIADPAGETQYLVEFAKERPSKDVE
jgi:predicted enzyme related to lactoylglutathione lyase